MQRSVFVLLTILALLLGGPRGAQAQTDIVTTTITEAVTSTGNVSLVVNSATGITAGIWLLVDNELFRVQQSYVSGTTLPVLRGPRPTTHGDNSTVWVFPIGAIVDRAPQGSCTRGSGEAAYTLTVVRSTGAIAACRLAGQYASGSNGWVVTDISGANGVSSGAPPETQ